MLRLPALAPFTAVIKGPHLQGCFLFCYLEVYRNEHCSSKQNAIFFKEPLSIKNTNQRLVRKLTCQITGECVWELVQILKCISSDATMLRAMSKHKLPQHSTPPGASLSPRAGCRHRLLPQHSQLESLSVLVRQLQDSAREPKPEPGLPAGEA